MKKLNKEQLERIADKWLTKNGACKIDFDKRDIIIWEGGLFGGEIKSRLFRNKRIWLKKLPSGNSLIKSCKLKGYKREIYYEGSLWFEELDSTINYLNRLKRLLNKHGFKTNHKPTKRL